MTTIGIENEGEACVEDEAYSRAAANGGPAWENGLEIRSAADDLHGYLHADRSS